VIKRGEHSIGKVSSLTLLPSRVVFGPRKQCRCGKTVGHFDRQLSLLLLSYTIPFTHPSHAALHCLVPPEPISPLTHRLRPLPNTLHRPPPPPPRPIRRHPPRCRCRHRSLQQAPIGSPHFPRTCQPLRASRMGQQSLPHPLPRPQHRGGETADAAGPPRSDAVPRFSDRGEVRRVRGCER
jgi:hypothetical protein